METVRATGEELSRQELLARGEALGASVRAPAVLTFEGELGAGKTTLITAVARGLGVTAPVTSPSFALVHRYDGREAPVYHLDLYRLSGPGDLCQLGFDELVFGNGVVLIEWPDRAAGHLPPGRRFRLSHVGEPSLRRLEELFGP